MVATVAVRIRQGIAVDRGFDAAFTVVCGWLVAAGYVVAWDALRPAGAPSRLGPLQELGLDASWFSATTLLLLIGVGNRLAGRPWSRVLPSGYDFAFVGCVLFGLGYVADRYWVDFAGSAIGVESLLNPPTMLQLGAVAMIVSGPLRAALGRRELTASLPTLVSCGLLLSLLTFATQFAEPLVDTWSSTSPPAAVSPAWITQDLGVASLVIHGLLVAGVTIAVMRSFTLPFGGLTVILGTNAVLLAILKSHLEFIPAMLAAGLVGDLLYGWLRPHRLRSTQFRVLAAVLPSVATLFYLLTLLLSPDRTAWSWSLWTGAVLLPGILGWLLSFLAVPAEPALSRDAAQAAPSISAWATPEDVRHALAAVRDGGGLAGTRLVGMRCLSGDAASAPRELEQLLGDLVRELAASRSPVQAEQGRILLDYYVRRAGTHEAIMETMHVSRATYFRRLDDAHVAVARRLDELNEFALRNL